MEFQLHDFLPLYNPTQTVGFDRDINNLTEFTKYKLPKEEEFPQHPGDLMLHQKLISNFMNPNTPYEGLLILHEMGTGKTCTAVAVAERFIQTKELSPSSESFPHTTLKNIVVLTKGKGLQGNFIHEIANVCTNGQYLQNLEKFYKNRNNRIRHNVKVNYTFDTFDVFTKKLVKMSQTEKTLTYENTLFIVDEAHNLRTSDPEESRIYHEIYGLFELLKNRKVLLLTGTPMKDKPDEIVDLMNLILKDKLTIQDLEDPVVFKKKIGGYVSYLRAMMSDVDRTEQGEHLGTLKHFKVYPVIMDKFQSKVYMSAKLKDDEERSIFNHSRQAGLMVFPDQTYGKNGFEKNIFRAGANFRFANATTKQELQTNLTKYSVKYADLIQKLKSDSNSGRLSFVFAEFVKGSGLMVLGLLLELNGYSRVTSASSCNTQKLRYAIFTNETSTESEIRKILAVFNQPKNRHGNYISVILGSRVIMEGFSFKNIQSEYILTPHWNYSETSQIIARGLRLGSHNDLLKENITPNIKIYHYAAFPNSKNNKDSIDLKMYELSETKDFQIQKVIRSIKEAAFDCELNKERNTITNPNLNNSRSCEYAICDYKCDNPILKNMMDKDRNYHLIYFKLSEDYKKLKDIIIQEVIEHPVTIEYLMAQTGFSKIEIMCVFQDLLDFQRILFSRPEGSYYLQNIRNVFFVSTTIVEEDDPFLLDFYVKNAVIFQGQTMDELVRLNQENFMVSIIDKLFKSKNIIELRSYMVQLPIYLQEKLLCFSISLSHANTLNNYVRDMVLNNFRLYYKIDDKSAFVWLNPTQYKCTHNLQNWTLWKVCSFEEQDKIEEMKKKQRTLKTVDNPYGYIGLLNRTTNDFCLKKADDGEEARDKRKRNVGKRCHNWKKKDLIDLAANRLKLEPLDDFLFEHSDVEVMQRNPKFNNILMANGTLKDYKRIAYWNAQDINSLCDQIMHKFIDQKLVVDDPYCGTSKKVR